MAITLSDNPLFERTKNSEGAMPVVGYAYTLGKYPFNALESD